MGNIKILNNNKKLFLLLIKIYSSTKIKGLNEKLEHLKKKRYFNILLYGEASYGKSKFINTIIGEKKTLIDSNSGTTLMNIYFISIKNIL